jgi:uncharacterized protein (DUF849 family)
LHLNTEGPKSDVSAPFVFSGKKRIMLIEAALNGGRDRSEHAGVPISPAELAQASKDSVTAGARAIHFHVRSADGRESLVEDDVNAAVAAVRAAVPSVPFGVSTGAWILADAILRHETVARWSTQPTFASVNFKEEGATELARLLLSRGVGIEVGLSDRRGAEILLASKLATKCLRILLEPLEKTGRAALEKVNAIEIILDRGRIRIPRLLHGLNETTWELIDAAAARGYDTRVGFEDILTLPDGAPAPNNAALVAETIRRVSQQPGH